MIPLGTGGAVLGALNAAVLRTTTMVRFAAPPVAGVLHPLVGTHLQVACGPVVTAIIWGDHRDHRDDAIARQMHDHARSRNRYVPDWSIARPIGINQAIGVQVSQPLPGPRAHQRQVLQAGIPAVDGKQAGLKPACCCCLHHRPDMVIVGQTVVCVVVDTDVAGQVGVPIGPQHPDQSDGAHDDSLLVPRPLARDQLASSALRRVQCRVVDHQAGCGHRHPGVSLFPQGGAIRTTPVPQTRGVSMRRTIRGGTRMAAYCFCRAEHVLRCGQNEDIVQFVTRR